MQELGEIEAWGVVGSGGFKTHLRVGGTIDVGFLSGWGAGTERETNSRFPFRIHREEATKRAMMSAAWTE